MAKVKIDKDYLDFLTEKANEGIHLKRELQVLKWIYRDEISSRSMDSDEWEAYHDFIANDWVKLDKESKEAEMLYATAMAERTDKGRVAFEKFYETFKDFKDDE